MSEFVLQRGRLYSHRRNIHQRFGGQQQGGISTPKEAPYIFLFTGESGSQYGYEDDWIDDGVYLYVGEGQVGDMQFRAGNKAIRDHAQNGKELLLFKTLGKGRPVVSALCLAFSAVRSDLRIAADLAPPLHDVRPAQWNGSGLALPPIPSR